MLDTCVSQFWVGTGFLESKKTLSGQILQISLCKLIN
jgi:hypothetical protein